VRRTGLGAALLLGATSITAILVERVPSVTCRVASGLRRSVVLFCVVLLLSVVREARAFGSRHAIAEFRLFLAFVSGAPYRTGRKSASKNGSSTSFSGAWSTCQPPCQRKFSALRGGDETRPRTTHRSAAFCRQRVERLIF
jgi:hypothetical protein